MGADNVRPGRAPRGAVLAALLVAACDAPTVPAEGPAYDPIAITGVIYHWPLGRTIAVYVDETQSPAGADLPGVVAEAARLWEDGLYYREFAIALVSNPSAADIVLHFRAAPRIVGTADCAPSDIGAGYTFFCPAPGEGGEELGDSVLTLPLLSGAPSRVKMDIYVDGARATTRAQLLSVVAHELGHALGIGSHSDESADLMFTAPTAPRPTARDARTLRYVLHQRAELRL